MLVKINIIYTMMVLESLIIIVFTALLYFFYASLNIVNIIAINSLNALKLVLYIIYFELLSI